MRFLKPTLIGIVAAMGTFSTFATEIRPIPATITHSSWASDWRNIELKAEIWDWRDEVVEDLQTWREYHCDYIPPETAGMWYDVFWLPFRDKPAALDRAIEGLSLSDAEAIFRSREGFFSSRPRHWNAFKDEIARIELVLGLHGLYWNVVAINGDRNARNLGYFWSHFGAERSLVSELSDPWHGYFELPLDDKPQALVDSIVGLDLRTARRIVDGGFFARKPADWKAFKDEIRRIERDLDLIEFYDRIVARHGSKNKQNLFGPSLPPVEDGDYNDDDGDYNDGDGDYNPPSPQPPPPPLYDCRHIQQSRRIWRVQRVEKLVHTTVKRVDVVFDQAVLLTGESEPVVLRWDGVSENISFDLSRAVNRYAILSDSRGSVYTLKSEGRRAINPNPRDFTFSFSIVGGRLLLNITDNRAEELARLSNGTYSLQISFSIVKKGGFCSSNQVMASVTRRPVQLGGATDITNLLATIPQSGDQLRVENLFVERAGTEYFSGSTQLGESDYFEY